eukprot:31000-Rhodomonas_salina.4
MAKCVLATRSHAHIVLWIAFSHVRDRVLHETAFQESVVRRAAWKRWPPHASARDGREMAYRWFLLALALIIQVESAEVRALLSAPENWTKCTTADQVGKADTQRHADNGMQGPSADFWGDLRAQMPSITLLQLVGAVPV